MKNITVIPGDGIGYEIMDATLNILKEISSELNFEIYHAGQDVYEKHGYLVGDDVYEAISRNKVVLKGPITTPIGSGFRSINVMLRKKYDLYCNIRVSKSFKHIPTRFENVDLVIFRENTEGLYIGEETTFDTAGDKVALATKRITYSKSKRIIEKAFAYADANKINKVTCAHKANILKLTDGLFLETAKEVGLLYPHIELEPIIIDNMCMQLVTNPQNYKVIVTMNLYGDIISDLAAGLVGGLGVAPGANLGDEVAIFEAVHGSAPDIAGKNIANPIALILSAVDMLKYLKMEHEANILKQAVENTLANKKVVTPDLKGEGTTLSFQDAIIKEIGLLYGN